MLVYTKGPDPDIQPIVERMSTIKHKILILSGKGGVGKSTFTSQLTYSIAMDKNKEVGVLDVDICGPSIPKTMGLEGEQVSSVFFLFRLTNEFEKIGHILVFYNSIL